MDLTSADGYWGGRTPRPPLSPPPHSLIACAPQAPPTMCNPRGRQYSSNVALLQPDRLPLVLTADDVGCELLHLASSQANWLPSGSSPEPTSSLPCWEGSGKPGESFAGPSVLLPPSSRYGVTGTDRQTGRASGCDPSRSHLALAIREQKHHVQ